MESHTTKAFVLVIIGIVLVIISLLILLTTRDADLSALEEGEPLDECNTLQYNGDNKFNIVFFSEKKDAEEYTDFLLDTQPFKNNPSAFNFFHIEKKDSLCERYKGIAILCYSRNLLERAASCPNIDFIAVLEEDEAHIRSSAYQNVMSLNINHVPSVFLHEFGHVFANLAEEYINNQKPPRGSANCANNCPEDFNSENDGCFNGCSLTSLQRSVEDGVMKTLSGFSDPSNPYGSFNANYIEDIIIEETGSSGITGQAISEPRDCSREEYILYDVKIGEKKLRTGCATTNGRGDYMYEITENGETIFTEDFNVNLFTSAPVEGSSGLLEGESFSFEEVDELILTIPVGVGEEVKVIDPEGNEIAKETVKDVGARPCRV